MDYRDLNLIGESSPHLRTKDGAGHIMGEVLIAMLLPLAFAVYNFGPRALATAAVSVAGCCAFEWLYRAALKKNNTLGDLSAAVTGVLIAFVCPVTVPYWVLLIGDFFAIVIVKQLFGGVGKNFLTPARAAGAFVGCWAGEWPPWV
ncbi:MAG: RnfABCDGE type electron transport complex subunit D, partial [Oscillospiraceae bacterium]|nr:RnfABCDGE type electron transport complex subunit D [Oscillospiraceae bacterium]